MRVTKNGWKIENPPWCCETIQENRVRFQAQERIQESYPDQNDYQA